MRPNFFVSHPSPLAVRRETTYGEFREALARQQSKNASYYLEYFSVGLGGVLVMVVGPCKG